MPCHFIFHDQKLEREGLGWLPGVLNDHGHTADVVSYLDLDKLSPAKAYDDGPVVITGSIAFCRRATKALAVIPGAYYSDERFRCSQYLPGIPLDILLNPTPIMAPFGVVGGAFEHYLRMLGTDSVFMRPDSGAKTFSGQVFSKANWECDFSALKQLTSVSPETLVMLSPVRQIDAEYRYVVVEREVITGSRYMRGGALDLDPSTDPNCLKLAEEIARMDRQIDVAYTCDIALVQGVAHLVELNAFSTSGLYMCDHLAAFLAVAIAAQKEFDGDLSIGMYLIDIMAIDRYKLTVHKFWLEDALWSS